MEEPLISYVLTTRNKFFYLEKVLDAFFETKRSNEEIIVADGGSDDGSVEYLKNLQERGKIDLLIEGPDKGQAHGTNRAMLQARGKFVKFLLDDDIFDFSLIRRCAEYLEEKPWIDAVASNMWEHEIPVRSEEPKRIFRWDAEYQEWISNGSPFWFSDLVLMIRRTSIALCGLWNINSSVIDVDYGMRLTGSGKIRLAWCNGCLATRVLNPSSLSVQPGYLVDVVNDVNHIYDYYDLPSFFDEERILDSYRIQQKESGIIDFEEDVKNFLDEYPSHMNWLENYNNGVIKKEGLMLDAGDNFFPNVFEEREPLTKYKLHKKAKATEQELVLATRELDRINRRLDKIRNTFLWRVLRKLNEIRARISAQS